MVAGAFVTAPTDRPLLLFFFNASEYRLPANPAAFAPSSGDDERWRRETILGCGIIQYGCI